MSVYAPARKKLDGLLIAVMLLIIIIVLLLVFRPAPAPLTPTIGAVTAQDGRVSANGRGQPGAVLELRAGSIRWGVVTAGADGRWTFAGQAAPGSYQLVARTLNAAGNPVNESAAVSLVVPVPSVPVALPAPTRAPAAPPTATALPTAVPPPAAAIARISSPQIRPDGQLSLSGTGQPAELIELWANNARLETVTAGSDGKWSWTGQLKAGDYQLRARTVDASGKVLNESEAQAVRMAAPTPAVPGTATPAPGSAGVAYVVDVGDTLARLSLEYYGEPQLYTRIVEATNIKAAQDSSFTHITDANTIEPGQKIWIPTK